MLHRMPRTAKSGRSLPMLSLFAILLVYCLHNWVHYAKIANVLHISCLIIATRISEKQYRPTLVAGPIISGPPQNTCRGLVNKPGYNFTTTTIHLPGASQQTRIIRIRNLRMVPNLHWFSLNECLIVFLVKATNFRQDTVLDVLSDFTGFQWPCCILGVNASFCSVSFMPF